MAGHSKWSKVKHIKGPLDQKRGQLFSKLAKKITLAAKTGGGNRGGNPGVRSVTPFAQAQALPTDDVGRAVRCGAGAVRCGAGKGGEAANYHEMVYEALPTAGQ